MRRIRLLMMLALSVTLLSLSAGMGCCNDIGKVELKPEGWRLNEPAFVVPVQAGRETVQLIETQAAEIAALRDYVASVDVTIAALSADVAELEAAHGRERAAWSHGVEALQRSNKKLKCPWAVGLFGGWDAVHNEVVAGVGVTYSLFRF